MANTNLAGKGRTDDLLALQLKGSSERARSGVSVSING